MPRIGLDEGDLSQVIQGWETAKANRAVTGRPLQIAGRRFERGVGTHTVSQIRVELDGAAEHFTALVGVDDAVGSLGQGAARFLLVVDGRPVADSGVRRGGEAAIELQADLRGAQQLQLLAEAPDDLTHHGHADWAEAFITYTGAPPRLVAPDRGEPPPPLPPPGPAPRFICPPVLGARPGRPVRFRIPCLGAAATFTCPELPDGLQLDTATGIITGTAPRAGHWVLPLRARNADGEAATELILRCDDRALAPTPPMGWCSWNAYGAAVTQADIAANHRALVAGGLHRYGYRHVNIDDGWQGERPADAPVPRALQPNADFPDLPGLVEAIHADGCLAGIYSVAVIHSPQGLLGGSGEHPDGTSTTPFKHGEPRPIGPHRFFREDLRQWAAWGFDMVKVDCQPPPWVIREWVEEMAAVGRDLVISLSANIPQTQLAEQRGLAQLWRTTGDLIDTWPSVRGKLWSQLGCLGQGGPGGWNDADMLVVGAVGPGWNAPRQPSRLTWREQALHIGLWNFLASPLLIGCDLTQLDATTRDLLTRPGLIALNQDPLGAPALPVAVDRERGFMQWLRPLADGGAVALVNTGEELIEGTCDLTALGMPVHAGLIDCWDEQMLEHDRGRVAYRLAPHDHRIWRWS